MTRFVFLKRYLHSSLVRPPYRSTLRVNSWHSCFLKLESLGGVGSLEKALLVVALF